MIWIHAVLGHLHPKQWHHHKRLDLTYVTPQIIASAMPSDSRLKKAFINNVHDLQKFLQDSHGSNWHIWSLQEDKELNYNPAELTSSGSDLPAVTRIPTPDHRPIPFAVLIHIVYDIRQYLEQSVEHVALVHCKLGMGRTGSVIIAYLIACDGLSYNDAMQKFTQKRIRFGVMDGVSILSQQRYLRYVGYWNRVGQPPNLLQPSLTRIAAITVHGLQVDDFEIELVPLVGAVPGDKQQWNVTQDDGTTILEPMPELVMPADAWLSFIGFCYIASVRVPVSYACCAFNLNFEKQLDYSSVVAQSESGPCLVSPDIIPGNDCGASNSIVGERYSFECTWEETDGLVGLSLLHGKKAFNSITITWI